jgi:hypothetical protein
MFLVSSRTIPDIKSFCLSSMHANLCMLIGQMVAPYPLSLSGNPISQIMYGNVYPLKRLSSETSEVSGELTQENPTLMRLEDQILWYSRRSSANLRWFRMLKIIELMAAAMIPFLATVPASDLLSHPSLVAGGLGILIVVLESFQGLFQFQNNWMNYRSTCEELKREKHLWMARAGTYAGTGNPDQLLAERIESVISAEHGRWIIVQESVLKGNCDPAK